MVLASLGLFCLAGFLIPFPSLKHGWRNVSVVAFSPDGKYLAAGLTDGTSFNEDFKWRIGDLSRTTILVELGNGFEPFVLNQDTLSGSQVGTPSWMQGEFLCFTPDSATLVVGTWDGTVELWDPRGKSLKRTLEIGDGLVKAVGVSHDGKTIAAATRGRCTLWDGEDLKQKELYGSLISIMSIAFSPDGAFLATAGDLGRFETWDLRSDTREPCRVKDLETSSIRYSPDGRLIAVGGEEGALLWQAQTKREQSRLAFEGTTGVAFSPDGKMLALTGRDRLHLCNVETGQVDRDGRFWADNARCVAYSPDGRLIATGQRSGDLLTVYDASTGERIWSGSLRPAWRTTLAILRFAGVSLICLVTLSIPIIYYWRRKRRRQKQVAVA
jgi:WD40 repeat protein